jgi:hypothetical protein
MYGGTYKRNHKAHSSVCFCRAKARKITYSERLSVALVIRYGIRMRRVLCDCTIRSHIVSNTTQFSGKKIIENKIIVF